MDFRLESDSMGQVKVPRDKLWGAQTQRSLENFQIGSERIPIEVIYALTMIKKAAAKANADAGLLSAQNALDIGKACEEVLSGLHDSEFPLSVWQTGSGTQTNMNVNEVIGKLTSLHPNDHINKSQSSNDTFPTAMHIAVLLKSKKKIFPALESLQKGFKKFADKGEDIKAVKIGRTHMQDATPIKLSQEVSAWIEALSFSEQLIERAFTDLLYIPLGGTAVGTGLNAPSDFDIKAAKYLSDYTGLELKVSKNKFHGLSFKDALSAYHSALNSLANVLFKIASDIKLLSSGPRCGFAEIILPSNEPGSSIMPGKVNPTQCEALSMLALRVMGNDFSISMANSQGQLQLNTYMPMMIYTMLQSMDLLADGMNSFNNNCVRGMEVNKEKIEDYLNSSLMLITCLTPEIGYEKAGKIAQAAYEKGTSLREEALKEGVSEQVYDRLVVPEDMV